MGFEQQLLAARTWQLERHQARPGLASFGHKDRFAGVGGIDQPRKVGFGLMHIHNTFSHGVRVH